ncbi:MAG: C45 family autoproteolytic acyltransferase/hydrolase [Candidatus Zipacnadales bacterium]
MPHQTRKQLLGLIPTLVILGVGVTVGSCSRPERAASVNPASGMPSAKIATGLATASEQVRGTVEILGEGEDAVKLLHLWGSPREMGYAHGLLCKNEVKDFFTKIITAMTAHMHVSEEKLDESWAAMEPFVPKEYLEEMEGLAEGAGVGIEVVKRAHAIPDLSEMDCTFFAAWGDFTQEGNFIQLRALDYATGAHIQDNPAIIVYHPKDGPAYVNIGWCGFIGMVTGMNAQQICMSEIGDDFEKEKHTLEGEPMPFIMRDVIRKATTVEEGIEIVRNAKRTSSFLYLIGDAKAPDARALKTGPEIFEVYDKDSIPYGALGNVVWMSMGADSKWNQKIKAALEAQKGTLTVETAMSDITGKCETGDLHTVYFDASALKLWVANADLDGSPAYNEGFVEFDFGEAANKSEP